MTISFFDANHAVNRHVTIRKADRSRYLGMSGPDRLQYLAEQAPPKEQGTPQEIYIAAHFDLGLWTNTVKIIFNDENGDALGSIKVAVDPQNWPIIKVDDWDQIQTRFRFPRHPTLLHYQEEFFEWKRRAYQPVENATVDAMVRDFLQRAVVAVQDKNTKEWSYKKFVPDSRDCAELRKALAANCHMPAEHAPPSWIVEPSDDLMPAHECIALQNTILHAPTGTQYPPNYGLFTRTALPFDYDPKATCLLFDKTLRDYWADKPDGSPADEVLLLQETFGYFLLPWSDLQKIFFWIGGGRNGKGVLTRILKMLLGPRNVANPTMSTLASANVGMKEALIGKLAAVISETDFGRNDDPVSATGFIKAVSGQDDVEISRKFKTAWNGRLYLRFLFTGNKVAKFADDSSAFAERIVSQKFERQFLDGDDDPHLTDKLALELPGIFNWALVGYHRLRKNGKFTRPASSVELTEDIKRAASSVQPFIEDACVIEADAVLTEAELYAAYMAWADRHHQTPMRKGEFVEALAAFRPVVIRKISAATDIRHAAWPACLQGAASGERRAAGSIAAR